MIEQQAEHLSPDEKQSRAQLLRVEFRKRPEITIHRAADFLEKEFPPLKLIIPALLPEGAIILAGPPTPEARE